MIVYFKDLYAFKCNRMHIVWYKILDCIFLEIALKDNGNNFLKGKLFHYEIIIVSDVDYG